MFKKYLSPVLLSLAVVLVGFLFIDFSAYQARAVSPLKQLKLQDATGIELGYIVGMYQTDHGVPNAQKITSYTTYLPSLDAVIQIENTNGGLNIAGSIEGFSEYYNTLDCSGDGYLIGTSLSSPWIIKDAQNNIVKIDKNSTIINARSAGTPGNCFDPGIGTSTAWRLIPASLPFNPESLTLPFKIISL